MKRTIPMTTAEFAREYGVSTATASAWARAGFLPSMFVANRYLIDRAALPQAIAKLRRDPRFRALGTEHSTESAA